MYTPNKEELEAYHWCVRNDVRVSPWGKDKIEVSLDGGKKWHRSPERYEEDQLWQKYFEICTYYYNKNK